MKQLFPFAIAALALPLAACEKKAPEVVDTTAPDPDAAELANRAPVELPPAILAQTTQRCADGSLIYVDFFTGNKLVGVSAEKDKPRTQLKSEVEGGPYTADGGWSLTGTQKNVTVTGPGIGTKTCHT